MQLVAQAAQDAGTMRDAMSVMGKQLSTLRGATGYSSDGALQH